MIYEDPMKKFIECSGFELESGPQGSSSQHVDIFTVTETSVIARHCQAKSYLGQETQAHTVLSARAHGPKFHCIFSAVASSCTCCCRPPLCNKWLEYGCSWVKLSSSVPMENLYPSHSISRRKGRTCSWLRLNHQPWRSPIMSERTRGMECWP